MGNTSMHFSKVKPPLLTCDKEKGYQKQADRHQCSVENAQQYQPFSTMCLQFKQQHTCLKCSYLMQTISKQPSAHEIRRPLSSTAKPSCSCRQRRRLLMLLPYQKPHCPPQRVHVMLVVTQHTRLAYANHA